MKLSNESYFSLNFMVRRSRPNKEGEFPILLRITMNGQRAEVYTNRYVAPNNWEAYIKKARDILPGKVERFGRIMGVSPIGITITGAEKRFGSCSAKNRICFSWRLMAYPEEAIDYVVVHELAHIRHKDHSKRFYAFVEEVLPDWRERRRLLRE